MNRIQRDKLFHEIEKDGAINRMVDSLSKWKMYRASPFYMSKQEMFSLVACILLETIEKKQKKKLVLKTMWELIKHAYQYENILYQTAGAISGISMNKRAYGVKEEPVDPADIDFLDQYDVPSFWIRLSMRDKYKILIDRFFYGFTYDEIAKKHKTNRETARKEVKKLCGYLKSDIKNGRISLWD